MRDHLRDADIGGQRSAPCHRRGTTVQRNQRLTLLFVLVMGLMMALPGAAHAATTQLSGEAVYDVEKCPGAPEGYEDFVDYPGLLMTGSLVACVYTRFDSPPRTTPSGAYFEVGQEIVVGSLNGGPQGTFLTTYTFDAKFAPDGAEIRGQCHHKIVAGSGTGGFEGATGRFDIKDIVSAGIGVYRGHIFI